MKKMTKIISFILTIAMLVLPLPAYAAEVVEDTAVDLNPGGISQTLQSMHETAPLETYPVIIWLKDIDTTKAVEAATSKIQNFETRSTYLTNTVRMTAAESEEYNRYIDIKRDAKRSCYEAYTANFASNYLNASEIVYCSKYLPVINAELSYARIKTLASRPEVEAIGYDAEDEVEETPEPIVAAPLTANAPAGYYTIDEMIEYLGVDEVWDGMSEGQGVNIGIIDAGIPNKSHEFFSITLFIHNIITVLILLYMRQQC